MADKQGLIEALADKEHASWARWMDYLFSRCQPLIGSGKVGRPDLIIPADLVERWQRQIDTPYADLSEREKQSDREEVAHILPIIDAYAEQQLAQAREELAAWPIKWAHTIDSYSQLLGEAREENAQARALLQEALDEMKEWLWVNRARREQTMQAMKDFLTEQKEQHDGE